MKIKLPQPKALPGEIVRVLNYRIKGREAWEYGRVLYARLGISASHDYKQQYIRWAYDVLLERKSKSNMVYGQERGMNPVRLVVNDEGIERI